MGKVDMPEIIVVNANYEFPPLDPTCVIQRMVGS